MEHVGIWSVLPPVIAIFLAIKTKQVYIALVFGIWMGWLILSNWNPLVGTIATLEGFVAVFKDAGNTRTIMFSALVGALLVFVQRSGGVEGFINVVNKLLLYFDNKQSGFNRVVVQLLAWFTGILLFVETSINVLTVGSLYRPIFDKLKIPREKLAYIVDSSSAPSAILIPLNAWGAFIMGLLLSLGVEEPFQMMISSMPYNFYPILALIMVPIVILSKKDFGPMRNAEKRTRKTGKLLNDNAKPMVSAEITFMKKKEGVKERAFNMVIPILTMVLMMPINLAFTGWANVKNPDGLSFMQHVFRAIGQGSGSSSVLYAVVTALLVAAILYRSQKIMRTKEMIDLALKGISGLMPLALLMMLAFAISMVCKQLGTGIYVAEVTKEFITPALVPFMVYIISSFIAFSTGTSWGTFAIMLSIAVPMAQTMDVNLPLVIAATLGGGVFGDHCSPISDTTILSSMASASDHIDHVKTQLPYALGIGSIVAVIYLIMGFLSV